MPFADAVTLSSEVDLPGLPLPLTGRTSLYAILGDPVAQAGSPALFNSAFRRRGWPAVLVPMQVKANDLAVTLRGLRGIGNLRGLVLTTPHKAAAIGLVDTIGAEARLAGSINAIRCDPDGRWHGENFDGLGCLRGLPMAGHTVAGRRKDLGKAGNCEHWVDRQHWIARANHDLFGPFTRRAHLW